MTSLSSYLPKLKTKSTKVARYAAVMVALLLALKFGWLEPMGRYRGIASSRATGLGAVTNYPDEHYQYAGLATARYLDTGSDDKEPNEQPVGDLGRRIIRSAHLDLLVDHPVEAAGRVQQLAQELGGYVVKSELRGTGNDESASLVIRVPAEQYGEARANLQKLAKQVNSEQSESDDATRQYVDTEARLRNRRTEEARYREILGRAATASDVLEVASKLQGVREEIEKTEAEFRTLSLQTATCSIYVYLHAVSNFQVFRIDWRPSYEMRFSARSGLESLASFVNSMMTFLFHLPAILLWCVTIIGLGAIGWRILKRALRFAFISKDPEPHRN
jgi:hypothetical protein